MLYIILYLNKRLQKSRQMINSIVSSVSYHKKSLSKVMVGLKVKQTICENNTIFANCEKCVNSSLAVLIVP